MCLSHVTSIPVIHTGLSGVPVEVVGEERAIKCLQRIDLLTVVRKEVCIIVHVPV